MTYEELRDAIDGLSAYDSGAADSGIRDEELRGRAIGQLSSMPDAEVNALLERVVNDLFLSPAARSQGYTQDDADALREWCKDQGIVGAV